MKVTVNFTLDIPKDSLAQLREFASAEDNVGAADFLRAEAEEHVVFYLEDNGFYGRVKVVRRDGRIVP